MPLTSHSQRRIVTVQFDRIVIAVPDLPAAAAQYQQLLGAPPYHREQPTAQHTAWWDLGNTVIELAPDGVDRPGIRGIVVGIPVAGPADAPVANALGIDVRACDGSVTATWRRSQTGARACSLSVDHVVLRTADAQACIDLFTGELGVRLALDRHAPQWGGRMLFFRAGKMTLEVIAPDEQLPNGSHFWGLAYACQDIDEQVRVLDARGVAVSAVREGRKPGTKVATVRSHCLDIPTLLIQPAT